MTDPTQPGPARRRIRVWTITGEPWHVQRFTSTPRGGVGTMCGRRLPNVVSLRMAYSDEVGVFDVCVPCLGATPNPYRQEP